ncbi:MAG: hypothetical protein ACK52I_32880 [Pseudomonadota bacterium]
MQKACSAHNILGKELFKKTIPLATILEEIERFGAPIAAEHHSPLESGRLMFDDNKAKGKRRQKKSRSKSIPAATVASDDDEGLDLHGVDEGGDVVEDEGENEEERSETQSENEDEYDSNENRKRKVSFIFLFLI